MIKKLPILHIFKNRKYNYFLAAVLDLVFISLLIGIAAKPAKELIQPLISPLKPINMSKSDHEIFGFLPYWNFAKSNSVDFNVLTTLAYFGIPITVDGNLDSSDPGFDKFKSREATDLFRKAHQSGTRVVLTITQMDNDTILSFLGNPSAQEAAISQTIDAVNKRGIDGVNVDFEYLGNPGEETRQQFSQFVANLTSRMHQVEPDSKVTVSVYAASMKDPKIYDIAALGQSADGIFMMAYDFATYGSDQAIPTAPLYGYKSGQYWYDISTAVADFTKVMDPKKLILGVPWYGYNYLVYEPGIKAETRPSYSWRGKPAAQPYASTKNLSPNMDNVDSFQTGWDDIGKVSWVAYHLVDIDTWRMIFVDDTKSLEYKYQLAKDNNLLGVGMWALGYDQNSPELWTQLSHEFGDRLADQKIITKNIYESN